MPNDAQAQYMESLSHFDTAMMVTRATNGRLHARPMNIISKSEKELWFATGEGSEKIREVERDERVLVVCQSPLRFLSLTGRATTVRHREKIREMWTASLEPWFDGPDDARVVLVCFQTEAAEYWDLQGIGGIQFVWDAARSLFSSNSPAPRNQEQHGVVDFRPSS